MAKTNLKLEMLTMVAEAAKSYNDEKGCYTMTESKFAEVKEQLNEKFVVKHKENLRAIAYATKKSQNLVVIELVADKKAAKKNSTKKSSNKAAAKQQTKKAEKAPKFNVSYNMQKDTGLAVHFCEFKMVNATEQQFEEFIKVVNEKFAEIFGQKSTIEYNMVDELENGVYTGMIMFVKIKGHSKDGYAAYKKAMTEAKAAMK